MLFIVYIIFMGLIVLGMLVGMKRDHIYKNIFSYDLGNDRKYYNSFCQEYQTFKDARNDKQQIESLNYKNFQDTYFLNKMSCIWMKKPRAFWIWADGLAFDQLDNYIEQTQGESATMKVNPPYEKASGFIHETYMTGQFSMNSDAYANNYDNIFRQMNMATLNPRFIGKYFPLYSLAKNELQGDQAVLDSAEDVVYFDKLCYAKVIEDIVEYPREEKFMKFKPQNYTGWDKEEYKKLINERLDKFVLDDKFWKSCLKNHVFDQNGIPLKEVLALYYTTIPDRFNHYWSKTSLINYYRNLGLQKIFISLQKYLMKNKPEVPFIITSDHGGQSYFGEDSLNDHGFTTQFNKPLLSISMDWLKEHGNIKNGEQIHYTDLSSTVILIFQNTNIPLLSQGTPSPIYKDNFNKLLTAFSHFNQLKQLLTFMEEVAGKDKIKSIKNDLEINKLEKKIKKFNDQFSTKYSTDDFVSQESQAQWSSKITKENISILNSFKNDELLEDLQETNKKIQQKIQWIRFTNKREHVFLLLILFGISLLISCLFFGRKFLRLMKEQYNKENDVGQKLWKLFGILLVCDILPQLLIYFFEENSLYAGTFVYIAFKCVLLFVITNNSENPLLLNISQGSFSEDKENQQLYKQARLDEDDNLSNEQINDHPDAPFSFVKTLLNFNDESPIEVVLLKRYIVEPFKKRFMQNKIKTILIISLIMNVVCNLIIASGLFLYLKLRQEIYNTHYHLILFTLYLIFYLIVIYATNGVFYNKNDGFKRWRFTHYLDLWAYRIIYIAMFVYDSKIHTTYNNKGDYKLFVTILFPLLYMLGYKVFSADIPFVNEERPSNYKQNLFTFIKWITTTFLFMFNDIPDKMAILFFVLPVCSMFGSILKQKNVPIIYNLLGLVCYMAEPTLIFQMRHDTFDPALNKYANFKFQANNLSKAHGIMYEICIFIVKLTVFFIPFLSIFEAIEVRKKLNNLITYDTVGKLINFTLILKSFILYLTVQVAVFLIQGEGFYYRWLNYSFVLYVLGILLLGIPVIFLQLRCFFCFSYKGKTLRIPRIIKKIIVIALCLYNVQYMRSHFQKEID